MSTETELPEALLVAKWLRESPAEAVSWADAAANHLERLHARVQELQAKLVAESVRTANEKLRANQVTQQHLMQSKMHAELAHKLASQAEKKG